MDLEKIICAFALAILTILVVPLVLGDDGCAVLAYYQAGNNGSGNYAIGNSNTVAKDSTTSMASKYINPTRATNTTSGFGDEKKIYHAYNTDIQARPVRMYNPDFKNGVKTRDFSLYGNFDKENESTLSTEGGGVSAHYYGKTNIRSETQKIKAYKRGSSTINITSIVDLEKSDYSKKPKRVTKDQYDYYYRPDKYTTLDIPDHYYSVERLDYKRGSDSNAD